MVRLTANSYLEINPFNVLIALPDSQSSLEDVIKKYPGRWPEGPWAGYPPEGWAADMSSDDKITIPETTVKLRDSIPICFPNSLTENEYPNIVIKLVGYGHGIPIPHICNARTVSGRHQRSNFGADRIRNRTRAPIGNTLGQSNRYMGLRPYCMSNSSYMTNFRSTKLCEASHSSF
jgi:hypothetical protein